MTEEDALERLEVLRGPGQALEGMEEPTRVWRAWLELPQGDPEEPSAVRDVLVWRAELRSPRGHARATLDDRTGTLLGLERM